MIVGVPSSRNPDGTIVFDRKNPFNAPAEINVDSFMSYERKFWKNRIAWKVQLNATNLYENSAYITVAVQPWGEISAARPAPERRWYVTNSFSF